MNKEEHFDNASNTISVFCRLNLNANIDLPVRISEMGLLIYITKNEEPVTPHMVAELMKVKKQMVTDMVAHLFEKGYLTKSPSLTDNRSYTLHPTEKAVELVEHAYSAYMKRMEILTKEMGLKDFDQMISLIKSANEILLNERISSEQLSNEKLKG